MTQDRYSRQILLPQIGPHGQRSLGSAHAVVIGCGALGTNSLSLLARAGVGRITAIDRDKVDITNIQRQTIFAEDDVGRPKAEAAEGHLRKINSGIVVNGVVCEVDQRNVVGFVKDATVVIDATDNMDTRFLVNDACVKHGIPWIYGGAVGISGMVLCVIAQGPCLRCVFPSLPRPGELPTCDTVGIVNSLPSIVASTQVTEAFKVMTGQHPVTDLIVLDAWDHCVDRVKVVKSPECRCCGKKEFIYLETGDRRSREAGD